MTDLTERWLPVPGWEDLYMASDLARVRSLDRRVPRGIRRGRVLKPFAAGHGYLFVDLSRDEVQTRWLLHRLIALTFLGPCPAGQQVRHGPNGKADNRPLNLCYGTAAENSQDRIRDGTGARGERVFGAKLTEADVVAIRQRHADGEFIRSLACEFGVNRHTMASAIKGKTWRHV